MCRLFGLAGAQPLSATFWLLDAPDSLRRQSHREPDGTGLGWFDDQGRPALAKRALAAYRDRSFAREARTLRSPRFVGHIRFASTGALEQRNTHPFELEGRLFAHNGVIEGLEELDRHLGADLAMVGGETDSERFFALITREIARRNGDVRAAIAAAVEWVAENLPLLSLNFVMIAPDGLWALRYPAVHELYVLRHPPGRALEQRSSHGTRIHAQHGLEHPCVVVASERMDDEGDWRELTGGELLHIGPALEVSSATIRTRPPAHPLTLAELQGRARASQG
jgi:predicted glutamine amidotransferase